MHSKFVRIMRRLCPLVLAATAACSDSPDGETEPERPSDLGRARAALVSGPTVETLQGYAAKCDEATGIHVPAFDCAEGVDVPQGTMATEDTLTDENIGMVFDGVRTPVPPTGHQVVAYGNDFWGTSDRFHFTHTSNTGNGFAEVYVKSLVDTHQYAKAGLMVRIDETQGSPHVALVVTPGGGVQIQKRFTQGGVASNETLAGIEPPVWLRLSQLEDNTTFEHTFTGYVSTDRITWTQVGSPITFASFPKPALLGLAVASHNPLEQTTATFEKFAWTQLPFFQGTRCDAPNSLHGDCDPGSRFQVLVQTPDAMAVANCRKRGYPPFDEEGYGDVAVIQYNRQNGALCFYQTYGVNGSSLPAPSADTQSVWESPYDTWEDGCTGCHDNGGFIRSPYLSRLEGEGFPERSASFKHWFSAIKSSQQKYVGLDFAEDKSWSVAVSNYVDPGAPMDPEQSDLGLPCSTCHKIGVNNFNRNGTAFDFALEATDSAQPGKTDHGPTSPIWMRPGQDCSTFGTCYSEPAHNTALRYAACADGFWGTRTRGFEEGDSAFDLPPPNGGNCQFTLLGDAWPEPPDPQASISIGLAQDGTHSQTYETHVLEAAGADIYGTADEFFLRYFFALPSDGTATVQVSNIENLNPGVPTHPFAKAGLMFRHDSGQGSTNVMMSLTAGSGVNLHYRESAGGATTSHVEAGYTGPTWLRLTRSGNVFTGYASPDQEEWTQIGPPVTIHGFSQSPYLGLALTSHDANQTATATFNHFTWTPAAPNTLVHADIGSTGSTYHYSAGAAPGTATHTLTNRGTDIYGNSDEFAFSYRALEGDGSVIVQVMAVDPTDPYAKAGIMFRRAGRTTAVNAAMVVTASQGVTFQARSTPSGTTANSFASGAAPSLLKLERSGNTFTGFVWDDVAGDWSQVGSQVIPGFGSTAMVGLVTTSHNPSATTTATFRGLIFQ